MTNRHFVLSVLLLIPLTAQLHAVNQLPVTGDAVVLVTPDQVLVTLGIEIRETSLAAAQERFSERAALVNAAITKLGIPAEKVRTDCLEIAPFYNDRNNLPSERLTPEYFRVNRVMTVTLSEPGKVDALVSATLAAGATHVLDVDFRTTELRKHRDEARRLALRAARDKATLLTSELGQHLGGVISINEGSYGWYAPNAYRQRSDNRNYQVQIARASANAEGSADAVVPPGQIAVSANVQVTFEFF